MMVCAHRRVRRVDCNYRLADARMYINRSICARTGDWIYIVCFIVPTYVGTGSCAHASTSARFDGRVHD